MKIFPLFYGVFLFFDIPTVKLLLTFFFFILNNQNLWSLLIDMNIMSR